MTSPCHKPVDVDADNLRTDTAGNKYFTRPGGTLQKVPPMYSGEAREFASELAGIQRETLGAVQPAIAQPAPIIHVNLPEERKATKFIGGRDDAGNMVMRPVYGDEK